MTLQNPHGWRDVDRDDRPRDRMADRLKSMLPDPQAKAKKLLDEAFVSAAVQARNGVRHIEVAVENSNEVEQLLHVAQAEGFNTEYRPGLGGTHIVTLSW